MLSNQFTNISSTCGCGKRYVGRTTRNFKMRIHEHIRLIKKSDLLQYILFPSMFVSVRMEALQTLASWELTELY
ncbi:hypothetical protein FKM82_006970 [Ascaphus truei]